MPRRKALVDQVYWDKKIAAGESFEVESEDLFLLAAIGRISEKDEEDRQEYATESFDDGGYKNREMKSRHRK